jgi:hypothetical protein
MKTTIYVFLYCSEIMANHKNRCVFIKQLKVELFYKMHLAFKFRWLLMVSVLMVLHMNQSIALNRWC